jgi:hypothetical protein
MRSGILGYGMGALMLILPTFGVRLTSFRSRKCHLSTGRRPGMKMKRFFRNRWLTTILAEMKRFLVKHFLGMKHFLTGKMKRFLPKPTKVKRFLAAPMC